MPVLEQIILKLALEYAANRLAPVVLARLEPVVKSAAAVIDEHLRANPDATEAELHAAILSAGGFALDAPLNASSHEGPG